MKKRMPLEGYEQFKLKRPSILFSCFSEKTKECQLRRKGIDISESLYKTKLEIANLPFLNAISAIG